MKAMQKPRPAAKPGGRDLRFGLERWRVSAARLRPGRESGVLAACAQRGRRAILSFLARVRRSTVPGAGKWGCARQPGTRGAGP